MTSAKPATPLPWPAVVLLSLLVAPILIFFNIVSLSGLASTFILLAQNTTNLRVEGTITDSDSYHVSGRGDSGPPEVYCYGRFNSDSGTIRHRLVRIYTDGDCQETPGLKATLISGVGWPEPTDARTPLILDGLFGMTDGAVVGHPAAFRRSLWPYLFIAPLTPFFDVCAIWGVRSQLAARRQAKRA